MSFHRVDSSASDQAGCKASGGSKCHSLNSGARWLLIPGLLAALTLGACGDSKPANPPLEEREQPYNQVDPVIDPITKVVPPGEQDLTPGAWTEARIENRPALFFGSTASAPLFAIGCDGRSGLVLQRRGARMAGGVQMMEITIPGETRRLAVNTLETDPPILQASLPPNHDLVSQLRGLSGPLVISLGDAPALRLPPDRKIGELVQKCAAPEGAASRPADDTPRAG